MVVLLFHSTLYKRGTHTHTKLYDTLMLTVIFVTVGASAAKNWTSNMGHWEQKCCIELNKFEYIINTKFALNIILFERIFRLAAVGWDISQMFAIQLFRQRHQDFSVFMIRWFDDSVCLPNKNIYPKKNDTLTHNASKGAN